MAWRLDDRWLWLGFVGFFVLASFAVPWALRDIVHLTEFRHSSPQGQDPDSDQQHHNAIDSLNLRALRNLLSHSNPNIRAAAEKLILRRFLESPGARWLHQKDLHASDERTREVAGMTLQYLRSRGLVFHPPGGTTHGRSNTQWGGRVHEESPEEAELRRRQNRLAMVVEGEAGDVMVREGDARRNDGWELGHTRTGATVTARLGEDGARIYEIGAEDGLTFPVSQAEAVEHLYDGLFNPLEE